MFYSQHGEDYLLWEFFEHRKSGVFVDVGAFDGVHLSNTYMLEQQGWRGICVEPHPKYAEICAANRPGSKCVNVACTHTSCEAVRFFADEMGLLSSLEAGAEKSKDIKSRYENRGVHFDGLDEITVPGMRLDDILAEHMNDDNSIDVLSIDVEGHEVGVLEGFNLERWRPRVIVIEANKDEERREIDKYLGAGGYVFARRLGVNLFYVGTSEDRDKLSGIYVRCVIASQIHPLGEVYTPKVFVRSKIVDQDMDELIEAKNELIAAMSRQVSDLRDKVKDCERLREKQMERLRIAETELARMRQTFSGKLLRKLLKNTGGADNE